MHKLKLIVYFYIIFNKSITVDYSIHFFLNCKLLKGAEVNRGLVTANLYFLLNNDVLST